MRDKIQQKSWPGSLKREFYFEKSYFQIFLNAFSMLSVVMKTKHLVTVIKHELQTHLSLSSWSVKSVNNQLIWSLQTERQYAIRTLDGAKHQSDK